METDNAVIWSSAHCWVKEGSGLDSPHLNPISIGKGEGTPRGKRRAFTSAIALKLPLPPSTTKGPSDGSGRQNLPAQAKAL